VKSYKGPSALTTHKKEKKKIVIIGQTNLNLKTQKQCKKLRKHRKKKPRRGSRKLRSPR
jgi:hypothetical protein